MGAMGTYYYSIGVLFLISAISDFIFNSQFSTCPFNNSAAGLFFLLALQNIILLILVLLQGFLINYFDDIDPNELSDLGYVKKTLTIAVRLLPSIIKLIHYVKVILVLVGAAYAFINNTLGTDYLTDVQYMTTYNATLNYYCRSNDSTLIINAKKNYTSNIIIFESIELFFVFFSLCILGIIKNLIDIDGYFYEPEDPNQGGCRTLLFRRLGP
jgi:hypothetical protein